MTNSLVNMARLFEGKVSSITGKMFRGKVVSQDDTLKIGRLQIRIDELFGDTTKTPDADLPWMGMMRGPQTGYFFYIPKKDDYVSVLFLENSVYSGVYLPDVFSKASGIQSNKFTSPDYGEMYGWEDEKGNYFLVNKKEEEVTFEHSSGTKIFVEKTGKTTITCQKELIINAEDTVDLNATKDVTVTGQAKITLDGAQDVTIESDANITISSKGSGKVKINPS